MDEQPTPLFIMYANGQAVLAPNVTRRQLQQIMLMLQKVWDDSLDAPINLPKEQP